MSNVLVFPTVTSEPDPASCIHEVFTWRDIALSVCPAGGPSMWSESGEIIDGAQAMAMLFGDFDLVGALASVRTHGEAVLVYSPGRRAMDRMTAFPPNRWIEGSQGLWFSHDGEVLLLSPDNPLVAENLIR